MKLVRCDRCKAELPPTEQNRDFLSMYPVTVGGISGLEQIAGRARAVWDVCDTCFESLKAWFEVKP